MRATLLQQKICQHYKIPPLLLGEPYIDHLGARMNYLRKILLHYPLPEVLGTYLLVQIKTKYQWIKLSSKFTIGRSRNNNLQLDDSYASRNHCMVFFRKPSIWVVKDLQSKNGIYVNYAKTLGKKLIDGDIIQIGSKMIIFMENMSGNLL